LPIVPVSVPFWQKNLIGNAVKFRNLERSHVEYRPKDSSWPEFYPGLWILALAIAPENHAKILRSFNRRSLRRLGCMVARLGSRSSNALFDGMDGTITVKASSAKDQIHRSLFRASRCSWSLRLPIRGSCQTSKTLCSSSQKLVFALGSDRACS